MHSVLTKWYCGCLTILVDMELREVERSDKSWGDIHTFSFEEGRSATEISIAIRLMAAAAREWSLEVGFITCFLDVNQAFDNVSPVNESLVMNDEGGGNCSYLG